MANVIIDIAEYNTLCDAQRENQELKRENNLLRDSSHVIIRTVKRPKVISVTRGLLDEGEFYIEFVNFDDVVDKVEKHLNKKICDLETQNYDNLRKIRLLQDKLKSKQEELDRIHINYKGVLDNIKTKFSSVFNSLDHKLIRHTKELHKLNNIINGI